jgi:hypothetical protein
MQSLQSFDEDVKNEQFYDVDVPAIPMYSQQNRVAMQSRVWGVAVPYLGMYYLGTQKIWLKR